MAGKADLRAMFKAARGQRDTVPGKLTKEQLRHLRAQRAEQVETGPAPAAASPTMPLEAQNVVSKTSVGEGKQGENMLVGARPAMPPPPPKRAIPTPSMVSLTNQSVCPTMLAAPVAQKPVSFRPDSQLSREGSYPAASVLSDASTGAVAQASAAPNNVASSRLAEVRTGGTEGGLPPGFLEAEAGLSEGVSAAENTPGPCPAYSAGEAFSAAASVADHSPAATSVGRGESGVPPGFFEAHDRSSYANSFEDETDPAPLPNDASATSQQLSTVSAKQGALPKGFFASTEADARARGEPPPKKKSKAETVDEFMASIAEDVRGVEEREEAEAEEAAVERINRETFEQRWVDFMAWISAA
eukprot:jgi/Botrbrau1/17267/Bobra.0015s0026.2